MPTVPSAPGKPVVTNITETSATISWAASGSNGGAAINGYLLRWWNAATETGPHFDSFANSLSRNRTGFIPGQHAIFVVYAHNAEGYSAPSLTTSVQLLGGTWIRSGGKWKVGIVYVRSGGKWHEASPYVRSGGTWHASTQ
jgi:hypothetical protein